MYIPVQIFIELLEAVERGGARGRRCIPHSTPHGRPIPRPTLPTQTPHDLLDHAFSLFPRARTLPSPSSTHLHPSALLGDLVQPTSNDGRLVVSQSPMACRASVSSGFMFDSFMSASFFQGKVGELDRRGGLERGSEIASASSSGGGAARRG